ncbi:hypothetical protein KO494_12560 [Lacinutrix sp. C3R15]|uniref:hypothetical protein n=1 Tax=Flavobacteriaceae TaxID=49546 RepID=UPI001C0A3C11|nr:MULTISPECIES: hypothetical protein [Flavobacteriaceae]MBU2940370.1 hypothetical protein [Lacinutrix sp. C3R15]MDO6623690.1 hypothetical protein [Oceanihabitans sp. 1_MG-2023]
MELNTFFNHDSDEQIVQKRTAEELRLWMSHISYAIKESDRLAKIASNVIKNRDFRDLFLELIIKNQSVLNTLVNYKSTMVQYKECDNFECDLYYINKHENFRVLYLKTITDFRKQKDKFYSEILK